ncbi:hypothetical protein AXF42_Ash021106 [Apostasia shenzhenica]|uniref:VAN3-binding protein-like auxin canalisation domain-containing protein n=1 Tax=Apostasia shenzhenica TaxID=1088818 RepID=A0A2I0A3F7_9ASPA|nr:hypothetical protein AXF42_Ash021106 [Apostasia shenzhenica]
MAKPISSPNTGTRISNSNKSLMFPINSLEVETGEQKSIPQLKLDDVKVIQHHGYGCRRQFTQNWGMIYASGRNGDLRLYGLISQLSRKLTPWNGISIQKWIKEMKQKRKEEGRLQKAEVHAAVSAIAVEATDSNALKQVAVASAAALVAAQCAQVAEAIGAKSDQINSAISTGHCCN